MAILFGSMAIFILGCMIFLWLISLIIKDASIIDIFWGFGFVLVCWWITSKVGLQELTSKQVVFIILVSLWGLRLAIYLAIRNLGKGEDFRYAAWRKQFGHRWWWLSFFRVFMLQGIIMLVLSSLFLPILLDDSIPNLLTYAGIGLWGVGFFFEAVGDYQMMRFKGDPDNHGKVMETGLWKYTRHPNYFGDALIWWGYFFFALSHPLGLYFIVCPLIMNFLLVRVSGVAMLEETLIKSKPKYHDYIRKTSAFIPRLPKKL